MNQKRPAARDISNLKARLGLKKDIAKSSSSAPATNKPRAGSLVPPPGAASPVSPPPGAAGILAPPGAASTANRVPAPPGAQLPQQQIPDASADPFGAMNAMAVQSQAAHRPEVVVVHDSSPVESVEHKAHFVKYTMYTIMVLLPLGVGIGIGQISSAAKQVNIALSDASKLKKDVKEVHRSLVNLNESVLLPGIERGGGKSYKLNDKDLTKALKGVKFPKIDLKPVYGSQLSALANKNGKESSDAILYENLLFFFDQSRLLRNHIREHVAQSLADSKVIDTATKNLIGNKPQRYAGYIVPPTSEEQQAGLPPSLKMVELASPLCGNSKQPPPCNGPPTGFRVREDETSQVFQALSFAKADALDVKKLFLLRPSKIFEQAIMGGKASLAVTSYMARIAVIDEKTKQLIEIGNALAARLEAKSKQPKRFTFFM